MFKGWAPKNVAVETGEYAGEELTTWRKTSNGMVAEVYKDVVAGVWRWRVTRPGRTLEDGMQIVDTLGHGACDHATQGMDAADRCMTQEAAR